MTVDILGIPHKVRFVTDRLLPPETLGQCDSVNAEIYVLEGLAPGVEKRIILHELVHAVADALDLGLTEGEVASLGAGLASIPQLQVEVDMRRGGEG